MERTDGQRSGRCRHDAGEGQAAAQATRIAVILRRDLLPWQRLNVTAFTISGIAAQVGALGELYLDASGNRYLPMFKDPVLVLGASADEIARTVERRRTRGLAFTIFTNDLFDTFDDEANRAAVAAIPAEALDIVGVAMRVERRTMDKVLKGLKLLD
jgi:hypothetical protein